MTTQLPGLRTGDLDHHDPDFVRDPWPTYTHLRAQCPVLHSGNYGGFWLLSRYDDVVAAAEDWESFTSSIPGTLLIPSGVVRDFAFLPLELDPPLHARYRALVQPAFSARNARGFGEQVRARADALLETLLDDDGGDVPPQFSAPLSAGTLALFMGLPVEDQELWVGLVRRSFEGSVRDPEDAKKAGAQFRDYIDGLILERRSDPSEDMISRLIASEVEGQRLTDAEIRGFVLLLLVAGHETTASVISYAYWWLATHPDGFDTLAADPGLLPTAVEEFIRLASPVSIFARNTNGDVEFRGATIPSGDVVGLSFSGANRDEEHFPDADTADLARRPNKHVAFGVGLHYCLGAPLARLEITTALRALIEREPSVRLELTGEVTWKGRGDALSLAHVPVRALGRA